MGFLLTLTEVLTLAGHLIRPRAFLDHFSCLLFHSYSIRFLFNGHPQLAHWPNPFLFQFTRHAVAFFSRQYKIKRTFYCTANFSTMEGSMTWNKKAFRIRTAPFYHFELLILSDENFWHHHLT